MYRNDGNELEFIVKFVTHHATIYHGLRHPIYTQTYIFVFTMVVHYVCFAYPL